MLHFTSSSCQGFVVFYLISFCLFICSDLRILNCKVFKYFNFLTVLSTLICCTNNVLSYEKFNCQRVYIFLGFCIMLKVGRRFLCGISCSTICFFYFFGFLH
uniref:Uncharacterized protein n=1 Tax=Opuntia streptacantha TaxID=393608 RepID=A0A7C9CWS0_OPUST